MPESPSAFRRKYLNISFDGVLGQQRISLGNYRSSFSGNEFRKNAYKDLRDFIKQRGRYAGGANGASHVWSSSGHMYSDLLEPMPYVHVDTSILKSMFQGVGRPQNFKNVLRAVDVYLTRVEMTDKHMTKLDWSYIPWSVQEYANAFFGTDCRGFVGAYLRENYPGVKDTAKDMSFYIDGYNKHPASFHTRKKGGSFERIDKPEDVRPHDVLVKCDKGDGKRHVAIIDSVGNATSMGVVVKTAESRGSKGLCELHGELRRTKKEHQNGQNARNWKHHGAEYNFVLRPKA